MEVDTDQENLGGLQLLGSLSFPYLGPSCRPYRSRKAGRGAARHGPLDLPPSASSPPRSPPLAVRARLGGEEGERTRRSRRRRRRRGGRGLEGMGAEEADGRTVAAPATGPVEDGRLGDPGRDDEAARRAVARLRQAPPRRPPLPGTFRSLRWPLNVFADRSSRNFGISRAS